MYYYLNINNLNKKNIPLFKGKVTQTFISVDDFCLEFEKPIPQTLISNGSGIKRSNRKAELCDAEVITLLIAFTPAVSAILNFSTPGMPVCTLKKSFPDWFLTTELLG